jgi:gamma-glutamylcyclotransferase (GGCT)/AIG2-like uncharacterized protein YtfP
MSKNAIKDLPLFAYGTLGESEVQQILLGGTVPSEPAMLTGWQITSSGAQPYRNISRVDGASTKGKLLSLSRIQLRIADQFEEIPFYQRIKVGVRRADGTELDAWLYTRPDDVGESPVDERASALPDSELLDIIRDYRRQLDRCDAPFGDLYILVPCLSNSALGAVSPSEGYATTIEETAKVEFPSLAVSIGRSVAKEIEVVCDNPFARGSAELGRHLVRPLLARDENSGVAVLTIPLPAVSVPVLPLLTSLSSGNLRVDSPGESGGPCTLGAWMEGLGMRPLSSPRAAIFLSAMPPGAVLKALKAERSLVMEIQNPFAELYEDRLREEALQLLVIELLLLKEASLAQHRRAAQGFASEIARGLDALGRKFRSRKQAPEEVR